jgi:hypothetical protein
MLAFFVVLIVTTLSAKGIVILLAISLLAGMIAKVVQNAFKTV